MIDPRDIAKDKQRIKLIVSYDGTDFCGWQKQKDHKHASELPNIQETMENALAEIFQMPISVSASGRTDAGVHAMAQVAHFDLPSSRVLPKDLCWALRGRLPESIVVKSAFVAPPEFHSTISAVRKTYRYWIWNDPRATALLGRYSWWVRQKLDLDYLNQCSKLLLGEHDFESFKSAGTPVKTTVRKIYRAQWTLRKPGLVQFEINGNGFMKQMVRNITGSLVEYSVRGEKVDKIQQVMDARDRRKAGPTAPPQGLFLSRVYYPKDLDIKCRQI